MSTISIEVDDGSAKAFAPAPTIEKCKLQLLLGLRLRGLMAGAPRSLKQITNEIGAQAEAKGMTPEILNERSGAVCLSIR